VTRRRFGVKSLPAVFLVADSSRMPDWPAIMARLPRGTGVILRDYAAPDRAARAALAARIARRRGLRLLIAGDAALARQVGAAGLHLPQYRLGERPPNRRPGWLVTAAAHDRRALARAGAVGADAVLVSPAFATASHPGVRALGPHRLARLIAGAKAPVIALGGIDTQSARRLPPGLSGVAAIGGLRDGCLASVRNRRQVRN